MVRFEPHRDLRMRLKILFCVLLIDINADMCNLWSRRGSLVTGPMGPREALEGVVIWKNSQFLIHPTDGVKDLPYDRAEKLGWLCAGPDPL